MYLAVITQVPALLAETVPLELTEAIRLFPEAHLTVPLAFFNLSLERFPTERVTLLRFSFAAGLETDEELEFVEPEPVEPELVELELVEPELAEPE